MTIKSCRTCKQEKLSSEFRKDVSQKDGRRTECKVCSREYGRTKYTLQYGEKARARNRIRYTNISERIREYKVSRGCILCGEREAVCLEFHHLDSEDKEYNLSGSATRAWDSVLAEIQKCVVLCSNCHKKVHAGILQLPQDH